MKIATNYGRKRIPFVIIVAIFAIVLATSATWFTLHAIDRSMSAENVSSGVIYQTSTKKLPSIIPSIPKQLLIPKINVDAPIEEMGVTSQGDMDSPVSPQDTGWYKLGPRPGGIGNAVIDGHFGWKENKPAVFDKLHTLAKGDLITVEDEAKNTYTFAITELRTFGPNDDAAEVFKSSDNASHLNLITCQGVWNKDLKSYSTRLVIFADLQR